MFPVADQVPLSGSYSSRGRRIGPSPAPPATSTLPSRSRTAVWPERGVPIEPVRSRRLPDAGTRTRRAADGQRVARRGASPRASTTPRKAGAGSGAASDGSRETAGRPPLHHGRTRRGPRARVSVPRHRPRSGSRDAGPRGCARHAAACRRSLHGRSTLARTDRRSCRRRTRRAAARLPLELVEVIHREVLPGAEAAGARAGHGRRTKTSRARARSRRS